MPFAALSATYFAHIGFFNPYLSLWLKDMGHGLMAIGVLTSLQSATRLFAPYAWGWLGDHTGERAKLLRYSALAALLLSVGLWFAWPMAGLALLLLLMFTQTSGMMPMSEAALAQLVNQGGRFDAKRYGRVRLCGSVGFLVTVMAAGAWFEHAGMGSFPAWATFSLLAVTLAAWWLPDHKEPPHAGGGHGALAPVLRQPAVRWFFASMFFHVLAHIALYLFFSELNLIGTLTGMILAHTVIGTPYVVIAASAALQNFDMQLMRAASNLGASNWMAFRRVMLPAIRPALVAGSLFAFVASFDEIIIVLFLAGPGQTTLPVRLFEGIRDELTPVVIAAAVVMILISVGLMALVEFLRRKSTT